MNPQDERAHDIEASLRAWTGAGREPIRSDPAGLADGAMRRSRSRSRATTFGEPRPPATGRSAPPVPPGPRAPQSAGGDEPDRRGSHATGTGQGFSWVLGWTIAGALLPGAGLLAAGRRRGGAAVLGVVVLALAALGVLAVSGNLVDRGTALAVNPRQLLIVAIAAAVVGLAWALVILLTSVQLNRYALLTLAQRRFGVLVVLALVAGVALPSYEVGHYALIQRGVVSSDTVFRGNAGGTGTRPDVKKPDPWAGTPRLNVLLIGSDQGKGRQYQRPDSMILASIDTRSGATVLISLPRNLQKVPFRAGSPGARAWPNGYDCGNECLLNAIWTWAAENGGRSYYKGRDAGLHATEDAIEGVTGLKVDNYVMLNLDGFKDFVDAIGKITVNVTERLPIGGQGSYPNKPFYRQAPGGWIEPGPNQKMNGFHALWFARSRWMSDDYHRMARQRCAIGAIVEKANPKTLAVRFPKIMAALSKNLSTGIATDDLPAWVELAQRVKAGPVTSLPLTREAIHTTVDPDFPMIRTMIRRAIADSRAAVKKAGQKKTPGPSTSPSISTTPAPSKKPKISGTPNPEKAQALSAVC